MPCLHALPASRQLPPSPARGAGALRAGEPSAQVLSHLWLRGGASHRFPCRKTTTPARNAALVPCAAAAACLPPAAATAGSPDARLQAVGTADPRSSALPVAPWRSPRFPRRRGCACSLHGRATAVVPVAVPRCRRFGKADPSPRCLAGEGASVFGTLGARLTAPHLQTPCGHGHGAPHHRCQGSAGHRHRCTHPSHPRTAALHPCGRCGWVMPGRQEDWGGGRSGVSGQLSAQAGCPSTPSPPPLPPPPPPAERDAW